ncbi:uncharacterized protein [Cicer arietinum]|uniref:uncharacterized protein n=1 Tax=Cicer arietinum TaxID=3827 RepID=UPI003CC5E237
MSRVEVPVSRKKIDSTDKFITDQVFPSREAAFEWISGIVIPLDSIHVFWRKLILENELEDEESLSDYDFLEELEAMKAYKKKHDIVSQRIFRARVHEVVFSHTTSILAPAEKCVDASQESAKQPSQRSARQPSHSSQYSAKQPFYTHFPTLIHSYIEEIIDVVADGNCGFRAIAALLGWTEESWPLVRTQLDKEIRLHQDLNANVFDDSVESVRNSLKISELGAQEKDKWMCIPDLGYVIATLYNVILVSLSRNLNMTFFPLNKAPSKECILAIGFVNENRWIKLKSNCPLPPTSQKWKDYSSECAKTWEIACAARMKHWEHIDPSFSKSYCISLNED